jgi:hypothetical protein
MSRVGEQELAREGRRILRKLVGGDTLRRCGDGRYALVRRTAKPEHAKLHIEAAPVEALAACGFLVAGADGSLAVSDTGRGWYLRAAAAADPFAAQHRTLEFRKMRGPAGDEISVLVNVAESPLALLRRRGFIDGAEYDAGERLRRDYTLASLTPRMAVDLNAPPIGGRRAMRPAAFGDTVLAAKERFSAALKAAGPGLSGVLFDICCDLCGLEACEKARGWPRASAKVVLRIGLQRLAAHYGFGRSLMTAPMRVWASHENVREA